MSAVESASSCSLKILLSFWFFDFSIPALRAILILDFISAVDAFVKVTINIFSSGTPESISLKTLSTITAVFPDPAAAATSIFFALA